MSNQTHGNDIRHINQFKVHRLAGKPLAVINQVSKDLYMVGNTSGLPETGFESGSQNGSICRLYHNITL